jgi:hypothetical protein
VDQALIKQPGRSFIESYLSLSVNDRPGSEYHLATVMLAGSDTVRDSLETIRPGEVALIKVTSAVIPPRDSHIAGLALFAQADYRLKTGTFC